MKVSERDGFIKDSWKKISCLVFTGKNLDCWIILNSQNNEVTCWVAFIDYYFFLIFVVCFILFSGNSAILIERNRTDHKPLYV